jgi:hypothetical protein
MASVALIGAVYGVSYVLVYLDGPFDIFERLRGLKWLREFGILECLPCTAFWVSLVIGYQQGCCWDARYLGRLYHSRQCKYLRSSSLYS